jgi:hypothetical protein
MKIYLVKGYLNYEGSYDLKAFTSEVKAKDLVEALIKHKENRPIVPTPDVVLTIKEIETIENIYKEYDKLSPLPSEKNVDYFDSYNYVTIEVEE